MQLTERDIRTVLAVGEHRALRRDQIQRLLYPSKNRANARLKQLYQHGFLARHWPPVRYGEGMGQPVYLLDRRGAQLVAQEREMDPSAVGWSRGDNRVGPGFLEHTLLVNDVRIALTLAARRAGCRWERWVGEGELAASPDRVWIEGVGGRRRQVAVIPDGYGVLHLGDRRAHFFLEADRGTLSNRRWGQRAQAYLAYVHSGQYGQRYGTHSLRVLTVTTGERRLANLKRTTERAGGGPLFWFTTGEEAGAEAILCDPIWQVAGQGARQRLI